ncbi:MAG: glycosyltransferase, partial [Halobacteriovoraceae bacterium]|nr:glycosyltransferase [Halobacteriovoraceae bacterium]
VLIHEQTSRMGLANKISAFFAKKILLSFKESRKFFTADKAVLTGYPLRDGFFEKTGGDISFKGVDLNRVDKPLLFITGGGNGSLLINQVVRDNMDYLKKYYFLIHQVGADFIKEYSAFGDTGYLPVDFIGDEIVDIYKKAKIIISRSGAGTVCELMALGRKSIFVPLAIAQRNEQYHNAMEAKKTLGSWIVTEEQLRSSSFPEILEKFGREPQRETSTQKTNPKFKILQEIKNSI